ncbi:MAG TPA: helix-turn-helix transcriptional regulator [Clostridiales bacterium]|nr:helix-turn-helix transcriptional regulator [Clostridiales bacterium]
MTLGEKLKKARLDANLSLRQAAKLMNLKSANSIFRWEIGERVPKLENRKKLAEIYKIDIMDLIE